MFSSISITSQPSTHHKLKPQWFLAARGLSAKCVCVFYSDGEKKKLSRSTQRAASSSFRRAPQTVLCSSPLLSAIVSDSTVSLYTSSLPLRRPGASPLSAASLAPFTSCNRIYSHCGYVQLRQTPGVTTRLKCISSDRSRSAFSLQLAFNCTSRTKTFEVIIFHNYLDKKIINFLKNC